MNQKIKDYLSFLPYSIPVFYFFGFILINGYLSNYGYSDYDLLNVTYLKAGVLFSALVVIIFTTTRISYTKETMTDNLAKAWKGIVLSIHNVLLITYMIVSYLIDFKAFDNTFWRTLIFILISIFFLQFFFFDNKSSKNNKWFLIFFIPPIIILLTINIIFATKFNLAFYLLVFNIALALFISVSLGFFGDNNYTRKIVTDFIIAIVACFIFGNKIYEMIPYKIGGGEPYQIVVDNNCLVNPTNFEADTLNVLYENDKHFLLNYENRNFVINKTEIKCFYLIKKKLPPIE